MIVFPLFIGSPAGEIGTGYCLLSVYICVYIHTHTRIYTYNIIHTDSKKYVPGIYMYINIHIDFPSIALHPLHAHTHTRARMHTHTHYIYTHADLIM